MSQASIQVNAPQSMATLADSGQTLAVSGSVVQLAAAAIPDRTQIVLIQVQDQPVRLTTDGQDPSASSGFRVEAGTQVYLDMRQARAAKFIRASGTDAKVYSEALRY